MKNMKDHIFPNGNCSKIFGRVMNTSSGPAVGSIPKLNTAGNMIMPAMMATRVSRRAMRIDVFMRGVSSPK